VGDWQKACHREPCKKKRKTVAQRQWCENNQGYFQGWYQYVKQWREQKKLSFQVTHLGMTQGKIPLLEPCLRSILVIPGDKDEVIQDEIRL
jgi:hypothetical protein